MVLVFSRFPVVSCFPALSCGFGLTNVWLFSRAYQLICVFLCLPVVSCFSAFTNGFVFSTVIFCLNFWHVYNPIPMTVWPISLLELMLILLYYLWSMVFFLLLQVTTLPLVPPLVQFLTKHPMVDKFDLSSLQSLSSGAAPLARDLEIGVAKRLPSLVAVRQGLCLLFL